MRRYSAESKNSFCRCFSVVRPCSVRKMFSAHRQAAGVALELDAVRARLVAARLQAPFELACPRSIVGRSTRSS
jgi:hypothetical protein